MLCQVLHHHGLHHLPHLLPGVLPAHHFHRTAGDARGRGESADLSEREGRGKLGDAGEGERVGAVFGFAESSIGGRGGLSMLLFAFVTSYLGSTERRAYRTSEAL